MNFNYYSDLLPTLSERAKLATIGRLGFSNAPLRRHLNDLFGRPYGQEGAFLGDPAFEAVFGWKKADVTMSALAGSLLTPELVKAMDEPPKELRKDYRFERQRQPYEHQITAWRMLGQTPPRSLVVASGTGSGKTECFMVPILDRLTRLRQEHKGRLVGVRALFLYPLNALINSQRERLRAWTEAFDGDIRYCLYNGNTPEAEPSRTAHLNPAEVIDRKTLRASPPPILVTNATMLEYMLVRTADAPILEHSQGKLEWIVLDEAHTYVGSQAAEAALLIRRVLFSFGVTPDQVRFVATSATIGDPEGEAGQKLKRFLADVAGVALDRVHLVAGTRDIPSIEAKASDGACSLSELCSIETDRDQSEARYQALERHPVARRLRELFVVGKGSGQAPVARLSEVCATLYGGADMFSADQQLDALRWLDLLSGTRKSAGKSGDEDVAFLPLRAHLFHQTMPGLWACADQDCPEKSGTALSDPEWPFGQVFLEPRKHCSCGSPAYDLVSCDDCGTVHLLAEDHRGVLAHLQSGAAFDEFELDVESGNEESERQEAADQVAAAPGVLSEVLIVNRLLDKVEPIYIERDTRRITESSQHTLTLRALEDGGDGLVCPACNGHQSSKALLFQHSRVGAPFLLSSILPTLLEFAPDGDRPADHPYRGRRLLTFNDSRQGTARLAAKLQQESERSRVRGLVYHIALQHGRVAAAASIEQLQNELQPLEDAYAATKHDGLKPLIDTKRAEIARLSVPVPLGFHELAQKLAGQGSDFDRMFDLYRRLAPNVFPEGAGAGELARMLLVREFGRRPKRLNNLESMGLVAVRYPALDRIASVPPAVASATEWDPATWRDFLKICLDFHVRAGGSLQISQDWRNWLGFPFPQVQLVDRDAEHVALNQRRWPRTKRSGMRSTLVRLLSHALKADITTATGEDRIDTVLQAAWASLCELGLLQQTGNGRVLPLEALAFSPMSAAWICPVTRRFLDSTLKGWSPYLPEKPDDRTASCRKVVLPLYGEAFAGVTDELDRVRLGRMWLAERPEIAKMREEGFWPSLNDRVIELAPYFTAAEHSAQQDSKLLDRYEKDFKAGALNLLSCSTTMEMGIDIGGISVVAMNNVPPHPANYLQRAGRAGRRKEARSLSMTLCKSNPHDQAVFTDSRWAFTTPLPAPQVSLDSPIIVQRHVRSLLLSHFLANALKGSGQDQMKLACGAFFSGEDPLAARFASWCRAFSEARDGFLARGLRQLLRGSVFEGADLHGVLDLAAQAMDELAGKWRAEFAAMEKESEELRKGGETSPAFRAVRLQLERLGGEYLLKELASRGYLPSYGFPTHLAPFDNLTRSRLTRQGAQLSRDDNRYRRRELPSRDLMTALREYAPGSEVVMDGLVYRSAGITLNWHIPADQAEAREVQNIRFAWRCTKCGASGSAHNLDAAGSCGACGEEVPPEQIRQFIEPAGFAVDFYKEPTNDVTTQRFVPVEAPWIDASGDWIALPSPHLGRFRVSSNGHVFHQSRGINGKGYAICLQCGRSEPMSKDGTRPKVFQQPHAKLRRNKEDGLLCPGSDSDWKIKEGISLGYETWTDVLELQLCNESGGWLNDAVTARTLSVALRDSLAELIGVQATELGCDVKQVKADVGGYCWAILLFDRFAAGYASSADKHLKGMFELAHRRLTCPAKCDSACPRCVLDFDQRFEAERLDRHSALRFLTREWLNGLELPAELAFFGAQSHAEYRPLVQALMHAVTHYGARRIRLYAAGSPVDWDIAPSTLREVAYRLAGRMVDVELILPADAISELEESERLILASLAEDPRVSVSSVQQPVRCGAGWLIAETMSNPPIRWGVGSQFVLGFNRSWAAAGSPLISAAGGAASEPALTVIPAETLRPAPSVAGDIELEVHHELDGQLQGFGMRFWQHILGHHPASRARFSAASDDVVHLRYSDRYVFSPLTISLLLEIVVGLKQIVGQARWNVSEVEICTTDRRPSGTGQVGNKVWADWEDNRTRDEVMVASFAYADINTRLLVGHAAETGHARTLEVKWASGASIGVRLDQGVSYWRAASSSPRELTFFGFQRVPIKIQAERIAELKLKIEGGQLPTQVFVKMRDQIPQCG